MLSTMPDEPMVDSSAAVRQKGAGRYGCIHYRRRCKLVAPCCGEVFSCRHCHNDVKSTNEMVRICSRW